MTDYPNLAGVATQDLVDKISGNGSFQASYINWSRTMQMLRTHAPGWLPAMALSPDGGIVHNAPLGAFLLIHFRHIDGRETPDVPQAIMDNRNASIPFSKVTARDITDTHRRGVCMAAALTFGLAYELWAKMPLESGYVDDEGKKGSIKDDSNPNSGAWEQAESIGWAKDALMEIVAIAKEYWEAGDVQGAAEYLEAKALPSEAKIAVASEFDSKFRSALKRHAAERKA